MSPPGQRSGPHSPVRAAQVAEVTTTTTTPTLPFPSDDRAAAARLKLAGMLAADAGTDSWWKSIADAGIGALAATRLPFEAYDLVALGVPEPDCPARWGPRLAAAAKRGEIEQVGYAPSTRPTVRGAIVRVWRGVAS